MKLLTRSLLIRLCVNGDAEYPCDVDAVDELICEGMVYKDDSSKLTDKGKRFVEMLGAVPLPEQKWVDPREAL